MEKTHSGDFLSCKIGDLSYGPHTREAETGGSLELVGQQV